MKTSLTLLVLFLIINTLNISFSNSKYLQDNQSPLTLTPKASNLRNHYGVSGANSIYNNNNRDIENFIKNNIAEIIPNKNKIDFAKELNKHSPVNNTFNNSNIKSGSFSNQANSAQKLISPSVAPASLHLKTEVNYPKVVEYSEFKGFKNTVKNVNVLDKKLNEIKKEKVLVSEPIYERQREVVDLPTKLEAKINLSNNSLINDNSSDKTKVLFGVDDN